MNDSNPKNWYIRLKEDFFDTKEIKVMKNMENGKDYIILLLQLRLLTINTKGKLQLNNTIPYNERMISDLTGTNIDIVRSAVKIFQELGFINMLDDGILYMEEVEKLIGYTSKDAQRKAEYREKIKKQDPPLLGNDMGQCPRQCPTIDIDRDIAIDKDIELDNSVSVSDAEIKIDFEKLEEIITRHKIELKHNQNQLKQYANNGMDLDIINNALMIPYDRNVMHIFDGTYTDPDEYVPPIKNPLAYSMTILEKWNEFGVRNIDDVKKYNKLLKSKQKD